MDKRLEKLTISVVGVGQIGSSFVSALRENKIGKRIIGVDKKEVVGGLRTKEIVDYATFDLKSGVKEADFIFLSTPVLTILKLLPRIIFYMKPEATLLDSGSTKKDTVLLMRKYPEKILIGGHPMAGTEKAGFEAASSSIFQNRIYALTFPTRKSLEGKKMVLKILEKIRAIPVEIDAERHDYIVSLTSHLPYILSLSLSYLAKDYLNKEPLFKDFIASGFLGASRLSLTHQEIGRGILSTNSFLIIKMMAEFSERFKKIKRLLENGGDEDLLDFLSEIRSFQSKIIEKDESTG